MKIRIKKRIVALNIGLIAVMIFSFIFIWAVGDRYTLRTNMFFEADAYRRDVTADIGDESVIKLDRIYYENKQLQADFEAVGRGETKVRLTYDQEGENYLLEEYTFRVNNFGTIFDVTYGGVNFNGVIAVIIAIMLQLFMMAVVMLWMFFDYRRKGEFSYPMIACGGLFIYLVILMLYVGYYCLNGPVYSFTYFLSLVDNVGLMLLLLLTPFMLIMSILLAVSNIWLMRHEGYRSVNTLGIIFAVLWFIGETVTVGTNIPPFSWSMEFLWSLPLYNDIMVPLVYIIGYMECLFISTVICSFLATKYKTPPDRDYIIILGCAIRSDGSLTPLLKGRVDSAVAFEKKQAETTGRHAVFVPSGGQGSDEVISEGEAMENYLLSIGIPSERIAREDKSVNTFENMRFSKKVIDEHAHGGEVKIAFATTNYHVFRGYILAKKNGFDAKGISAKTKPYFFPNAFLREFIGLLVDQKWKHLIFIVVIAAFFTLLRFV